MTSVLPLREQAETSEAAQKVGGYSELVRLQDERNVIMSGQAAMAIDLLVMR